MATLQVPNDLTERLQAAGQAYRKALAAGDSEQCAALWTELEALRRLKPRRRRHPLLNDWAYLHEQYVARQRSGADIARELGAGTGTVWRALVQAGIPTRPRPRAASSLLADRGWCQRKYVDEELTLGEIGAEVGCVESTVLLALRRHGIDTRQPSELERTRTRMSKSAKTRAPISEEVRANYRAGQQDRRARERAKAERKLALQAARDERQKARSAPPPEKTCIACTTPIGATSLIRCEVCRAWDAALTIERRREARMAGAGLLSRRAA